jgi:hypothetical protein
MLLARHKEEDLQYCHLSIINKQICYQIVRNAAKKYPRPESIHVSNYEGTSTYNTTKKFHYKAEVVSTNRVVAARFEILPSSSALVLLY